MSVTIDSELLTVYDKLNGNLSGISSTVSDLNSKLNSLKSTNSSFSSEISSGYQGDGLQTAISTFTGINEVVDSINSSLADGPLKAISEANDLVSVIGELKTLKDEIDALEKEQSELGGKWSSSDKKSDSEVSAHNAKVDEVAGKITEKTNEFNEKHSDAKSKLSALKAINPTIKVTKVEVKQPEVPAEVLDQIANLQPGTYNKFSYTASNGTTLNYCIYVPANAKTTTGLPLHLYMGGSGEVRNANAGGLAKLLTEGQQSTGIVVVLEASSSSSYQTNTYLQAAKELSDKVVKTYNVDTNRISISGHSLGGAGAFNMAEMYPNYFSVCVPVCGYNNYRGRYCGGKSTDGYASLAKVKIRAVCGVGDTNSVNAVKTINSNVNKAGGDMTITMVSGGHRIQFKEYGNQVEMEGKTYANLLEYCLAQTKA